MKSMLLILVLFFSLGATGSPNTVETEIPVRNSACQEGQSVYEPGRYKAAGSDPFFSWHAKRDRLFALKTGECIHMPFWIDDAKGIHLAFLVPLESLNRHIAGHEARALSVKTMVERFLLPQPALEKIFTTRPELRDLDLTKYAIVNLAQNDFANTASGPIRPTYLYVWTESSANCYLGEAACRNQSFLFLDYYVDSQRAKYAGEEPWGLVKKVGAPRSHYSGAVKQLSYFDREGNVSATAPLYKLSWSSNTNVQNHFVIESGYEINMVGTTVKSNLPHGPGQTYNLAKWKVGKQTIAPFNMTTDIADLNLDLEFFAPLKDSPVIPLYWNYLEDMKVVYYTDEPPAR